MGWQEQARRRAHPERDLARFAREQLWHALQPVTLANCDLQRFGEDVDGGYLVCANLLKEARAGYSYGISGYDGWGCQVATSLEIPVHQYDCFDVRKPVCAAPTEFHAECIGVGPAVVDGRPFDALDRQVAANGHGADRILMKIDVEGAEWDVFLSSPDETLNRIDQLIVEFHGTDEPKFFSAVRRLRQHFHVANLHMNNHACAPGMAPFGAWAYEVLFVNKRLTDATATPRATPFHALDRPNTTRVPDCQVPTDAAK